MAIPRQRIPQRTRQPHPEPIAGRRWAAGALAVVVLLVVTCGTAVQARVSAAEARAASATHHAQVVTDGTRVLSLHLVNAETAQRGYLLSQVSALLAAYRLSAAQVARDLRALALPGAPGERPTRLEQLVRAKAALLARTARLEQEGRHPAAVALVTGGRGARLTARIDAELAHTRTVASGAAEGARAAAARARAVRAGGVALAGTLAAAALLGLLATRRSRFRRLFVEAPSGMAVVDLGGARPGAFREVNASLCRMTGYTAAELQARDIGSVTHPDDRPLAEAGLRLAAAGRVPGGTGHRLWVRADGTAMPVKVDITVLRDAAGRPGHALAQVVDVSAEKAAEERLLHEARHDPLTGLANRRLYWQLLGQALGRAQRHGTGVGVCYIDLDDFKLVNDRHGHAVGDQVLQLAAARIAGALRAGDTPARLGGDEFAVVSEDVASDADLDVIRRRLAGLFDEPVTVPGAGDVDVHVSIGAVRGDLSTGTGEELTTRADAAMYAVKHQRKHAAATDGS